MKTVGLSDRRTLPYERNLTIKTVCAFVIIFWRSINLKCLFLKKHLKNYPDKFTLAFLLHLLTMK